jgi:galactokinase
MAIRTFWAPGRVNLIGEYTDLIGGLVLPAALDLGIRINVSAADRISLRSGGGQRAVLGADGTPSNGLPRWGRYVAAVAAELALLGRPPVGIEGSINSTLPVGVGLSSSAALEVALALALCAAAEFPLPPLALAQAARRAEHRAVGVPCGIMDQAASVLGRAGCAVLLDTGTLEYTYVELPEELELVIVDSGIRRTLERSAYAERRRELERAMGAGEALDETLSRRLRHVETENRRVRQVVDALTARRLDRLGELLREGHASLRDDLEVTIPELDRLVDLAYEHGAVAARMTGAGFGGAIVILAEKSGAQSLADAVVSEYGGSGKAYVCRAADGARELT